MHSQVICLTLDCELDEEVVQLVLAMNRIRGIHTVSSCQGEPGPIEPGFYGHVAFTADGTLWNLFNFCTYCLKYQIDGLHFEDDVALEIDIMARRGWLRFRNEALPKVTEMMQDIAAWPLGSSNGWNQEKVWGSEKVNYV
jgi:hypothetical protein